MLSKKISKFILIGGIGALINSIVFTLLGDNYEGFFLPCFYFIHSLTTILAGYLLLKRNKLGAVFLIISFFIFLLALFIPASFSDMDGSSLFLFTIAISVIASLSGVMFFVPIFTFIFLFSVGLGVVMLLIKD